MPSKHPRRPILTAKTADKHALYQAAVQTPDVEVAFITRVFKRLRGRVPLRLREDFCGTAAIACEWVRSRADRSAVGIDLHGPTLAWGMRHNAAKLDESARERLRLHRSDVRAPGEAGAGADVVLALNFSYWVFKSREVLRSYFESVHRCLGTGGVFILDAYGGYEVMKEMEDRTRCHGFTYVWDQARYEPISGDYTCHIHFEFKRGPAMRRAFTYHWRLWTVPELREILAEAGFKATTVYWEGEDERGKGNGIFRPQKRGEADATFVCYFVAEK